MLHTIDSARMHQWRFLRVTLWIQSLQNGLPVLGLDHFSTGFTLNCETNFYVKRLWMERLRIFVSTSLPWQYLISGQQYESCPHSNGNNGEGSGKDQESPFHSRSLVPPWHLQEEEGDETKFSALNMFANIFHASKVWNYIAQGKGTITPNWDLRSTMMARKGVLIYVTQC